MKKIKIGFATVLVIATSGCGVGSPSYSLLPAGQSFTQSNGAFNNQLDILFIVDDQPNMSAFQASLVASFQTFIKTFQTKGFDFKIAVETTSGYLGDPTLAGYSSANSSLVDFNDCSGSTCSGTYVLLPTDLNLVSDFSINAKPNKNTAGQDARAFSSFRQALRSTRPIDSGFLRQTSFLAVVIVDNQEDFSDNGRCSGCNMNLRYNDPNLDPVSTYINFLNAITNSAGTSARYNVSAMTQIATPCQGGTNMTRIMSLANQTNGILGDICQSDYGASMTSIASQIATLSTQFYLSKTPQANTIVVTVNGTTVSQDATNGWTYSSTANSIMFHGTSIPSQGAIINVQFVPTTINT